MNKVGLSSDKCNNLYEFIIAHKDLNYNSIELYEQYTDSEFLKFSWVLDACDCKEQLVILTYIVAKWVDQQICANAANIEQKYSLLYTNELTDILNAEIQDIDADFIELMYQSDYKAGDLESRLLGIIERN